MKWKQRKFGFIILVLLTIGTLALAYQHNVDYQRYIEETTQEYANKGINHSLNFWAWSSWGNGHLVIVLAVILSCLWTAISMVWLDGKLHSRKLRRRKLLLLVLLVPMLLFTAVNTATATGATDRNVDILFVGDEEFMAGSEDIIPFVWYVPLTEMVEIGFDLWPGIFPMVKTQFSDELGINLVFHGWVSYDSNDETPAAFDRLQEALEETGMSYWVDNASYAEGGYWKFRRNVRWDNAIMDILVVWTLQDMDLRAFAPFPWGSLIIKYKDWDQDWRVLQHELSHLYDLRHCSHSGCIMNYAYLFNVKWWKYECKDYMIQHKDYFTRTVSDDDGRGGGGGLEMCAW